MRTTYCGLVSEALMGQTVTLMGWAHRRRDHGGVIFIDLRDREGLVQVVFDPAVVSLERLLQLFWESHDPTQGMRQGNDTGTQYRSAIHATDEAQYAAALASREAYQAQLDAAGYGPITTEIVYPAPAYYYAEDYHQQYLAKNPNGYCGIGGTGVSCPIGLDVEAPR